MAAEPPVRRPLWMAALDRAVGWAFGLPSETSTYTYQPVKIPLPDGVILAADLYQPVGASPKGTILARGPYGRAIVVSLTTAQLYAARGYQVLFVSCRGTFGSTGVFDAGRSEAADGQAVVAWMREQAWYTGTFATLGDSYLGYTQWALLADPPPDMVAAVVGVGPHDFAQTLWGKGAFGLQLQVLWSDMVANQESWSYLQTARVILNPSRLDPLMRSVPLEPALRRHFGDKAPWLFHDINEPDVADASWARVRHGTALDKADLPILLISRWHDVFLELTMEQYEALSKRGCPVALRIGAGAHTDGPNGDSVNDTLLWLDKHLARNSRKDTKDMPPVAVQRGGHRPERLDLATWPPPTSHRELFLASDGKLVDEQSEETDMSIFVFDPSEPTPMVGGSSLWGGGQADDSALCTRYDVITFTTEPLREPLDILGRPSVDLVHSSDNPFCDLFVRLSVVDAKGVSRNITEQYRRIDGSVEKKLIAMDMPDTAYRIPRGSRVRLVVAGGCFPKHAPNLGTGESIATGTILRPARHLVHFGGENVSCLVLPVSKGS